MFKVNDAVLYDGNILRVLSVTPEGNPLVYRHSYFALTQNHPRVGWFEKRRFLFFTWWQLKLYNR